MREAPEPEEIVWQNANLSKKKRVMFTLLGWSLSFIVLVVLFVIFFFILQAKAENLSHALYNLEKYPDDKGYLS